MLNIYYGRENLNKDQFIFDKVRGKTLLLVPDQFTLQAEKDAFFYLGAKGLMDLQVVSFSRLGMKVLQQTGGGLCTMIDKYGRHMLLTRILMEQKDALTIYQGLERKNSFIELTNNFISELKQHNIDAARIAEIAEVLPEHTFLKQKLVDIHRIFQSYEEQISGKYVDTEDYVSLYAGKIPEAKLVQESSVWVYGFDSFTPKNREVLGQLMRTAKEVNVVMTWSDAQRDYELFELSTNMIQQLCRLAEELGVAWQRVQISDHYLRREMPEAISVLEQELYAIPSRKSGSTDGLKLVNAANLYGEAESAATEVLSLVREQGLSYKDIILICNDLETRGSIMKRVFAEYGMELFVDRKQSILHNPAAAYVLVLLDIVEKKYRNEDIFRFLKTDLTELGREQIEDLENYVLRYRIRGSMWKKPFFRGEDDYKPGQFQELEKTRQKLMDLLGAFESGFQSAETISARVEFLYRFLTESAKLPEKIQALMKREEAAGFLDAAGAMAQVWGLIVDVLDQFVEVIGAESQLASGFGDILKAGFESIELSVLPPSADGLMLGTMQRTRTGGVKAMLVLGANEGVLPASTATEAILSEEEKRYLVEQDIQICKLDELRQQEEKLAIYRSLTRPSRELWISCASSDVEGKECKPSEVFEKIRTVFPEVPVEPDVANRADDMERIQSRNRSLGYLTEALRRMEGAEPLSETWRCVLEWYRINGGLEVVTEGLLFSNRRQRLDETLVERLYRRDVNGVLSLSPSRLEKYSRCPFSHLIQYGLRPDEVRIFEVGSREIGDLYHSCLMELSKSLTREHVPINAPDSPWMTVTREECREKIMEVIARESPSYRGGVLSDGEEARYRTQRLGEICSEIGWILVDHVRRGQIQSIGFEEAFGRGEKIGPIWIDGGESRGQSDIAGENNAGNRGEGANVAIEGKIDRLDVLADDSVKIIDYKTGHEKFDPVQAEKGFKLQLMLYLKAAQEEKRQPAGVFYFLIREPSVDAGAISQEDLAAKVEAETGKNYKLEGVMVNRPEVIDNIAGEFERYSDIVPLKKNQKGEISGTTRERLMEPEQFQELQDAVERKVEELCNGLTKGNMEAHPKKSGAISACTYCKYKGICKFDLAFDGCKYELV